MDIREITEKCAQGTVLIDVRTPEEYAAGHIPGALNLPLDRLSEMVETQLPDKTQSVITYCLSGIRSEKAAEILRTSGFQDVENIGGIRDWTGDIAYEVGTGRTLYEY